MSERKELIKLLSIETPNLEKAAMLADYLLSHGVTIPVRCAECKHHDDCICVICEDGKTVVCGIKHKHKDKDDFCKYGERIDND